MAMACSAVVIELPNGVFITQMPAAVAALRSMLSMPMPARPTTLQILGDGDHLGRHLGGGTDGEAVILADDVAQFLGLQADLLVDLEAAVAEYLHGGGGKLVRNQNLWHGGHPWIWFLVVAKAQSSQSVSASRSACSTVPPHQMRRPGGASR